MITVAPQRVDNIGFSMVTEFALRKCVDDNLPNSFNVIWYFRSNRYHASNSKWSLKSFEADDSLSLEVQNRIRLIIKENESAQENSRELREFVDERGLIDSADYLLTLLPDADEEALDAIHAQLQKITGKTSPREIDKMREKRSVEDSDDDRQGQTSNSRCRRRASTPFPAR